MYAFEPYGTVQTPTQRAVKSCGIARPAVPSGLEEIMKNGRVDKNVNIYRTYDGVNISVEKDCKVAIYTIDGRLVNIINAVEGDNYGLYLRPLILLQCLIILWR